MAKHPRKRQKTNKDAKEVQPLGSNLLIHDDASKDDEERKLESMLFGTKFVPRGRGGKELVIVVDDDEDNMNGSVREEEHGGGKEMRHLKNADLFFVDYGQPSLGQGGQNENNTEEEDKASSKNPDSDNDDDDDGHDSSLEDLPTDSESGLGSDASSSSSSSRPRKPNPRKHQPQPPPSLDKSRKPSAWTDPSDPPLVSLAAPRLRKLRDAPSETTLSGHTYETRLRRQYERIHPEPEWAARARKGQRKASRDVPNDSEDEAEDGNVRDLLSSTAGVLAPAGRKARGNMALPAGMLSIERLRDANQAAQGSSSGEVKVVTFHPSDRVPVLCVGTADRRVRLFNVDGHTSPLLLTLHLPSLPLTSPTSAAFHPLGSSILLTGSRPFFYTHDLQTGATVKHARGLWGISFATANDSTGRVATKRGRGREGGGNGGGGGAEGMQLTAFSPHTGALLAAAGRGGHVHLVDWKGGTGQVVGSLKCNGGVRALWWAPGISASTEMALGTGGRDINDARYLTVLTDNAEVYIWDVGQRRCVRRWRDEGGFRGAGRVMSGCVPTGGGSGSGWLGVGSNTGYVNLYGHDAFSPYTPDFDTNSTPSSVNPKPLKQIGNLTTPVSTLRFNHDGQILAMASKEKKDAARLIHLPSQTAFANWPTSSTPLGHVTALDFSARSEYLAIGNTRGRVLLYHLKDYGYGAGAV